VGVDLMSPEIDLDEVAVELDRRRVLRLDMQALSDLHKAFGVKKFDPEAVLNRFQDGAEPDDFGVLLWALGRKDDPELTVEKANRLLTLRRLPAFLSAFQRLVAGEADGGSDAAAGPRDAEPSTTA
jgi:hypothetical protein